MTETEEMWLEIKNVEVKPLSTDLDVVCHRLVHFPVHIYASAFDLRADDEALLADLGATLYRRAVGKWPDWHYPPEAIYVTTPRYRDLDDGLIRPRSYLRQAFCYAAFAGPNQPTVEDEERERPAHPDPVARINAALAAKRRREGDAK